MLHPLPRKTNFSASFLVLARLEQSPKSSAFFPIKRDTYRRAKGQARLDSSLYVGFVTAEYPQSWRRIAA